MAGRRAAQQACGSPVKAERGPEGFLDTAIQVAAARDCGRQAFGWRASDGIAGSSNSMVRSVPADGIPVGLGYEWAGWTARSVARWGCGSAAVARPCSAADHRDPARRRRRDHAKAAAWWVPVPPVADASGERWRGERCAGVGAGLPRRGRGRERPAVCRPRPRPGGEDRGLGGVGQVGGSAALRTVGGSSGCASSRGEERRMRALRSTRDAPMSGGDSRRVRVSGSEVDEHPESSGRCAVRPTPVVPARHGPVVDRAVSGATDMSKVGDLVVAPGAASGDGLGDVGVPWISG
ncbi:hypothetical protein FHX81_3362 [Saccharothrix saharensis]|uniref:Uncharacterized protein n=1 Tax=Saccharothrix saharensis TaxID=571190 RepID=A0A543JDW6_9PSEU|nr:hypothetical protein FHX81_3362 [Saccharothrix saharensis]